MSGRGTLCAAVELVAVLAVALVLAPILVTGCASEPKPQPLKVGGRLAAVMLYDQNEQPHRIDASVRVILFARDRDKDGDQVIQALLADDGAKYLAAHRAAYVVNVSDVPRLIANMLIVPKMRERAYPTLLDRDGKATARYPSEEGRVTILVLDKLRVQAVVYRGSVAGLRQVIDRIR